MLIPHKTEQKLDRERKPLKWPVSMALPSLAVSILLPIWSPASTAANVAEIISTLGSSHCGQQLDKSTYLHISIRMNDLIKTKEIIKSQYSPPVSPVVCDCPWNLSILNTTDVCACCVKWWRQKVTSMYLKSSYPVHCKHWSLDSMLVMQSRHNELGG